MRITALSSQLVGLQLRYGWGELLLFQTHMFSLIVSSQLESWALLYHYWQSRKLTRLFLRDFADSANIDDFSLGSLTDSWALLYDYWQSRKLTRHMLRDFADSANIEDNLSGNSSSRSAVLGTSTTSSLTLPLPSSLLSSGSSLVTPCTTETPLTPQSVEGSRGWQWLFPRPKERYLRDPPGSHFLCYPPCVSECLSLFKGVLFNVDSTGSALCPRGQARSGWTLFPRLARRRIRSLRVPSIARYWVWQKLTFLWFYLLGLTSILLNA